MRRYIKMRRSPIITMLLLGPPKVFFQAFGSRLNSHNILDESSIGVESNYDDDDELEKSKTHTITDDSRNTTIYWFTLEMFNASIQFSNHNLNQVKEVAATVLNDQFALLFGNFQEFHFNIIDKIPISRPYSDERPDSDRSRKLSRRYQNGISQDLPMDSSLDDDDDMEQGIAISFSGLALYFQQPLESRNKLDREIIKSVNAPAINAIILNKFHSTNSPVLEDIYYVRAVPYASNSPSWTPSEPPTTSPTLASSYHPSTTSTLVPSSSNPPSVSSTLLSSMYPTPAPSTLQSLSSPTVPPSFEIVELDARSRSNELDPDDSNRMISTSVAIGAGLFILVALLFTKQRDDKDER